MKKTLKKTPPLTETPIEETKGKTISIYLDAESLRYLDNLCKLFKKGRSETIQFLLTLYKKSSLALIPLLPKDQSYLADIIREMAK
jgi:hypothetical protein